VIPSLSERALILAPTGRDAFVAADILRELGIATVVCRDIGALVSGLQEGAGFALVTEEALHAQDLRGLMEWLGSQPEWSDFPFVLLTFRGGGIERNPAAGRYIETLGNVTFLERPFHPTTLSSLARSAIRGRRRQYEARARLVELHESEARYRQIVEGAEDFAIVTLDDAGIITSWNSGAERITLFSEAEAIGRPGSIIFTEQDRLEGAPEKEIERARAAGRAVNERWHVRRDGSTFWGSGLTMRMDLAEGGFLKIFRDRTAEHQSEQAIRELNETLEERVAARTLELSRAEEALRQSQKMEAMGSLTGGVAHDFNNLLTPIVATLDLLQRKRLGGEREQRFIEAAMQSAERAKTLVQRLLAFARRQPLQPTGVDLVELIHGMAGLVQSTSGPRVVVEVDLAPDLPAVLTDRNQLEMAILNLAVNARDAMPEGGTLTIAAEAEKVEAEHRAGLQPGTYVRLAVTDTGQGMDEQTLARAIEPFFSTKGIGKGTGLGLSMVHGLAAQLGGGLAIASATGRGTRIELWLPTAEAAAEARREHPKAPSYTRAGTVLLVDDEPLIRMSTADMLIDLGFEVVEAASGEQALELVRGGLQPSLLVTDHLMAGMSGTQLAGHLRGQLPDIGVLVISGYADVDGIAPDFPRLTKPFHQYELAAMVGRVLEGV
jgi:PAS domain S-box-containing protein